MTTNCTIKTNQNTLILKIGDVEISAKIDKKSLESIISILEWQQAKDEYTKWHYRKAQ